MRAPRAAGGGIVTDGRPAAFIDRDGTVIRETEYLADPDDVELLPGAVGGLRALAAAGYTLVIITNQSGIARGYYDEAAYEAVDRRVRALLEAAGAPVSGSYHCPHHPDFTGPCDCRKPAAGLFLRAAAELTLDPRRSLFIGDRLRDVAPARALGGRAFLVRTGYGEEEAARVEEDVVVCADLAAVAAAAGPPRPGVDTPGRGR